MWNQPRKSYRSPQKNKNQTQRLSTTCPMTSAKAQKPSVRQLNRQCPLHFNQPTHICLTCRKSICLRCALTYCQQHVIRTEGEVLLSLREELFRFQVVPKIEQIQIKLVQSKQRQQYLQKKVLRLIQGIQSHFEYICQMLQKKKLQIIQYYDQQFQKYLQEHRNYDQQMRQRAQWLKTVAAEEQRVKINAIEEIDSLSDLIKKTTVEDGKMQKKITKMLMGKDKIRTQKLWSEQKLQKVLFQIENICFIIEQQNGEKRKRRITTQNANQRINTVGNIKSSSNSRVPSGRRPN